MTTIDPPTRAEILAARAMIKLGKKMGRPVTEDVIRDAAWPLSEAAPYPEDTRSASRR
jgi:hypothetical protein